jgi:hypothetical protein
MTPRDGAMTRAFFGGLARARARRDAGQWMGERRDLVQPGLSEREFCGARAKQPYRPSSCA